MIVLFMYNDSRVSPDNDLHRVRLKPNTWKAKLYLTMHIIKQKWHINR